MNTIYIYIYIIYIYIYIYIYIHTHTHIIVPDGFTAVNKNPCIGKPSTKFMSGWAGDLTNVESKSRDLVLYAG